MRSVALVLGLGVALCTSTAHSQTFKTLVSFTGTGGTASGYSPRGSLTLSGSTLYGMTFYGGINGLGNVFSVGVNGTNYQNLVSFTGAGGAASGANPNGSLTLSGSTLYGMTNSGGTDNLGTLFSVDVNGASYQNLVSFSSATVGVYPLGGLTLGNATLYGMTTLDGTGPYDSGTIFSVGTGGANYQNLVTFTGTSGAEIGSEPFGDVTLGGTTLYGMTNYGGVNGLGNIFSVSVSGTNYQNLLSFTGSGGAASGKNPQGSLTLSGTTLFGMTEFGGAYGYGNIFSVGVNGTNYQNLVSFTGSSGTAPGLEPHGSLTLSGTTLYGMTNGGGSVNGGVIFSVGIDGSGYQDLYSFFTGSSGGAYPDGDVTLSGGTLFGMTNGYGTYGDGTIFAFDPTLCVWQAPAGGSWKTVANWTSLTSPNAAGLEAVLANSATNASTITLDGSQTVGSLTFNNGTASYTLSAGSGGILTLDNSGGTGSQILVLAGTHSITAPVEIADGNLTVTEESNSRLSISGNISDDNGRESLTLDGVGSGVLILSGTNSYGGGTIVEAGSLVVTNPAALPVDGSLTVGSSAATYFGPIVPSPDSAGPPAPVPEPNTFVLIAIAAMGLLRRTSLGREKCPAPNRLMRLEPSSRSSR